jgi:hypothetical protein
MSIKVTQMIDRKHMQRFHEILCDTDGRYLRDPMVIGERVSVQVEMGDYVRFNELWARVVTPIKEVDSTGFWPTLKRRVKYLFNRSRK